MKNIVANDLYNIKNVELKDKIIIFDSKNEIREIKDIRKIKTLNDKLSIMNRLEFYINDYYLFIFDVSLFNDIYNKSRKYVYSIVEFCRKYKNKKFIFLEQLNSDGEIQNKDFIKEFDLKIFLF